MNKCLHCKKQFKRWRNPNGGSWNVKICKVCFPILTPSERNWLYQKERQERDDIHGDNTRKFVPDKLSTHEDFCAVPACREEADLEGFCMFHYKQKHLYT